MTEVYKFKVKLGDLENLFWRDLELSSNSSVAMLGYTVLASYEASGSHLFKIMFRGKRYEIEYEENDYPEPAINPIVTKLSDLKLGVGDKFEMVYDFGNWWEFEIELISIREMKRGEGRHYPYIADGQGRGIIEEYSSSDMMEFIKETDETGSLPEVTDNRFEYTTNWDYRDFKINICNALLKGEVMMLRDSYERIVYIENE